MNQYAMEAFLYTSDFGEDNYLFNSSSSSDSEDDVQCTCQCKTESQIEMDTDEPEPETTQPEKKIKSTIDNELSQLNSHDFKTNFRVTPETFEKVLEMLFPAFNTEHRGGREKISVEKSTYIFLWYLGNQETFKQMATRFNNTMSSVHGIIKTATKALSSKIHEQIIWPSSLEYPNISQMFQEISNLKGCIGVLGVSYIKFPKPRENGDHYVCVKNYPSMVLQGAVTINGKFLDIFVTEGSNDPEQILQQSELLTEAEIDLLGDYYLVGCSNYHNRKWLIQPFEDFDCNTPKHLFFNTCHEAATNIFSESLGLLKGRFQRLQNFENRDVSLVTQCITSACMIHNLAVDLDDESTSFNCTDTGIFENSSTFNMVEYDNERRDQILADLIKDEGLELVDDS